MASALEGRVVALQNELGRPADSTASPGKAGRRIKMTISEGEINAVYRKWSQWYDVASRIGRYVIDPQLRLFDNEIVIAGRVSGIKSVLSLHLIPIAINDQQVGFELDSIRAGVLPIPQTVLAGPRDRLIDTLRSRRLAWQTGAKLSPPNSDAANFMMADVIVKLLEGKRVEGDVILHGSAGWVAARIESLTVQEGSLTATFRILTDEERAEMEAKIKSK